jgi:hypothetical protein
MLEPVIRLIFQIRMIHKDNISRETKHGISSFNAWMVA